MKLEDSIGFQINQTGRRLSQLLGHRFLPYEVTTEQWSVLARLNEEDGISQKDLAHRVGKDQTNVTRILDQLERKGLVVRRPNPDDRRSFLPFVTPEGRTAYDRLVPIEEEVISAVTEGISAEELDAMKNLLIRIADRSVRLLADSPTPQQESTQRGE